jgi:hypothetical protein
MPELTYAHSWQKKQCRRGVKELRRDKKAVCEQEERGAV